MWSIQIDDVASSRFSIATELSLLGYERYRVSEDYSLTVHDSEEGRNSAELHAKVRGGDGSARIGKVREVGYF